jgi:HAD superfamily hydrolase (TIGR01549 family)
MLLRNGIKAVFYDLDGTLRTSSPLARVAFADQAACLGLPVTPEDHLRIARWEHYYFAGSDELRADRLSFTENAFWVNYSRRQLLELGASPQQAEELAILLNKYMRDQYQPQDVLLPDVPHTLKVLKDSGYILAVVSNREEPYQDYLQEIGLGEYFDFSLAAGEVNCWKPDKGVFECALQKGGVQACETVYIGDNYYADVLGARNAGMKPVLLDVHGVFELDQPGFPVVDSHMQILDLLEKEDGWSEDENESSVV